MLARIPLATDEHARDALEGLIGARRGSSLAVGYGDGAMYLGTDALALAPFTKRVTYLEDDDWVVLKAQGATVYQGRSEVQRCPAVPTAAKPDF